MKKLFTLLTGALLLILPILMAGCDDSDQEVFAPDGRLVSEVVIQTSMPVFKGMEISLMGQGFLEGDKMLLRASEDLMSPDGRVSSDGFVFTIPDQIVDQTTYKFILQRGDEYQVLGSSKLTVQLVVNASLGKTISAVWEGNATIGGNGFQTTDKLILSQGGGDLEASIANVDDSSLTFVVPKGTQKGDCEFTLQRGSEKQVLGTTKLDLSISGNVPDKAGMNIKGIVFCDGAGVENVLVSDGDLITQTNENGYYWLASEKRNALVFVILPSGYDVPTQKAAPQFWAPCTETIGVVEQHDFQLFASANDRHTMVVATDMHLANRNSPLDYIQFANGFVSELKTTYNNSSEKVYALNLGDFSWDGYWYSNRWALPECKNTIQDLNFQMWSAMGNHDNDPYVAEDFNAEGPYRQHMGPVYYAMNIGKVHYIMLDNTIYLNKGGSQGTIGDREYYRRFDDKQIAWLKKELEYVDKQTPIVVGYHCPVYSYSSATNVTVALQSQADVDKLLTCFAGFTSVNMLSGHTHVNRNIQSPTYPNVYEHNIAAVCGTWWWTQQYGRNNVCTDGTPAGYKVFSADGENIKWQYKAVDLPQTRQFMTYDMNKVKEYWTTNATALKAFASGNLPNRANDYVDVTSNTVYLNIWDYEPGWVISVKESGTALNVKQVWKRDPLHTISYDIPRGATTSLTFPSTWCMHMFAVTASSATSTLEISVTDRFGNTWTESMTRPKAFTTDVTK